MKTREQKETPQESPMTMCSRDIELINNLTNLVASARSYAISQHPEIHERFNPNPANRNNAQDELEAAEEDLDELKAAEKDLDDEKKDAVKKTKLKNKIKNLKNRIKTYDDMQERDLRATDVANLKAEQQAIENDTTLSHKEKNEKLEKILSKWWWLRKDIESYNRDHPHKPNYMSDSHFQKK